MNTTNTKVKLIKKKDKYTKIEYVTGAVAKYKTEDGKSLTVSMKFSDKPRYGGHSLCITESYVKIKVKTKGTLLPETKLNKEYCVGNITEISSMITGNTTKESGVHSFDQFLTTDASSRIEEENPNLAPFLKQAKKDILKTINSEKENGMKKTLTTKQVKNSNFNKTLLDYDRF